MATSSRAEATRSASTVGPSETRWRYSSITTAVASWSRLTVGRIWVHRPAACSATSEVDGHATTTWQPRRTASATAEALPTADPSGASTTTRSRLPAQPGSPPAGPGHEGHRAPRLQHRPQQPGVGTRGDDRPRPGLLSAARDRLLQRLRGLGDLAPHPGTGLGEVPQLPVDTRRGPLSSSSRDSSNQIAMMVVRSGGLAGPRRPGAPGCRRAPGRPGRSPSRPAPPPRRPARRGRRGRR